MHIFLIGLKILALIWVILAALVSLGGLVYLICDMFCYRYKIPEAIITMLMLLTGFLAFAFLALFILANISPNIRIYFQPLLS